LLLPCSTRRLLLCYYHWQVHMLSMGAAGVLFWGKRSKPRAVLAALRLLVLAHSVAPAVIRWVVCIIVE
jgi:hypothetical protein